MRRRCLPFLLAPLLLLAAASSTHAQTARAVLPAVADSSVRGAEAAGRAWLDLLDRAQFDSAWVHVVPVLRAAIPYSEWRRTLLEARGPFLPVGARRLRSTDNAGTMFPGRSYMLGFSIPTVQDSATSETVVMVREQGVWRVGGYGVRR